MEILCPVSLGELVDKISILRIKLIKITNENKLVHVQKEEQQLSSYLSSLKLDNIDSYILRLITVNTQLWEIEDDVRVKEASKEFDETFIELARSVYVTNDKRFILKNEINEKFNSSISEVKSYEDYGNGEL